MPAWRARRALGSIEEGERGWSLEITPFDTTPSPTSIGRPIGRPRKHRRRGEAYVCGVVGAESRRGAADLTSYGGSRLSSIKTLRRRHERRGPNDLVLLLIGARLRELQTFRRTRLVRLDLRL